MTIARYMLIGFLLVFSSIMAADKNLGGTNKTKPIIGFPPFMKSIGTLLDGEPHHLYDQQNNPVTSVNDILYIPSTHCKFSPIETESNAIEDHLLPFYNYKDQDLDGCKTDIKSNLTWYTLNVPQGQNWSEISSWDELDASEISAEYFVDSIPASQYSPALKIPEDAIGKRLGFIYTPISSSGNPTHGLPIKVWDLDYFFGQLPYETPGNALTPNDGTKLAKIDKPSGGGLVVEGFTPPEITDLRMSGSFLIGESLEAKFDFVANTTQNYDDLSRLWWGKSDTTTEQAHFYNSQYSTDRFSPKLTEEDIAAIYEVSVLPIKNEEGYFVVGKSQTIKSDDPNNELAPNHRIENLIMSPNTDIIKNNAVISATYTFNNGGDSSLIDSSTYNWDLYDPHSGSSVSGGGTIKVSGSIPAYTIKPQHAGYIVELTVDAKDQFGRLGEGQKITSSVETLESLEASKDALSFTIADTKEQQITINAFYSTGTMIDATSLGKWSSNDPDILVTNGLVSISDKNTTTKSSSITFELSRVKIEIPVFIKATELKVSDIRFTSALQGELQLIGQKAAVSYRFDNSSDTSIQDNSIARFYIVDSFGNETALAQSSNSRPGHFESIAIDLRHEGDTIFVEITPRDQQGLEGQTQTHSVKVSKLLSLEITPPQVYVSIPTELEAIATFSGGIRMDVTDHGDWTSPDEPFVEFTSSGNQRFITARHGILKGVLPPGKVNAIIEFDFSTSDNRIAYTEINTDIHTNNMTNLFGNHTEHAFELTLSNQESSIFKPWGGNFLTSIKDEDDTLLIGSDGGQPCGTYSVCDFDLSRINNFNQFDIGISNAGEVTLFQWRDSISSTSIGFVGSNYSSQKDKVYTHLNLAIGDWVGLIFYSSGPLNSNNNKITGIRVVYKLKNP